MIIRPQGKPKLEVVAATDAHAAELAEFFRAVWDPDATPGSVLSARSKAAGANLSSPGQSPPTFLAIQGGRILGYVGTLPIQLWDGHESLPAYWIKGLMVLPEFRNGPIGMLVLKEAARHLPRTIALTVAPASRRLFGALGYEDLGAVPNLFRPLDTGRILARLELDRLGLAGIPLWMQKAVQLARKSGVASLVGRLGGLVVRGGAAALRLPARHLRDDVEWPGDVVQSVDRLWESARRVIAVAVVRDGRYLQQRYGHPSEPGPYHWVGVWEGDLLAGVAIVREPHKEGDFRLAGIRVATLADILVAPDRPAAGLALLGGVERCAGGFQSDGVLATVSSPVLKSWLGRQGYLALPGNVHFFLRDVSGGPTRLRRSLAEWWLSRGDGESDQVF